MARLPGPREAGPFAWSGAAATEPEIAPAPGASPALAPVPCFERSSTFTDEDHAFFAAGDALSVEATTVEDSFDDLEERPRSSRLRRWAWRIASLLRRGGPRGRSVSGSNPRGEAESTLSPAGAFQPLAGAPAPDTVTGLAAGIDRDRPERLCGPAANEPPLSVPRALHQMLDFLEERRASVEPAADLEEVSRQLHDHLAALGRAVMDKERKRFASRPSALS